MSYVIREVLILQKEKVCVKADITVDGIGDFDSMIEYAAEKIKKRLN